MLHIFGILLNQRKNIAKKFDVSALRFPKPSIALIMKAECVVKTLLGIENKYRGFFKNTLSYFIVDFNK